ncbi:hypothetical protein DFH09DRAFT_1069600 [Mycena vulgaris]|nr:hypothetical protein DFH09DRAFT_1069600 [Mycena vulgaris]
MWDARLMEVGCKGSMPVMSGVRTTTHKTPDDEPTITRLPLPEESRSLNFFEGFPPALAGARRFLKREPKNVKINKEYLGTIWTRCPHKEAIVQSFGGRQGVVNVADAQGNREERGINFEGAQAAERWNNMEFGDEKPTGGGGISVVGTGRISAEFVGPGLLPIRESVCNIWVSITDGDGVSGEEGDGVDETGNGYVICAGLLSLSVLTTRDSVAGWMLRRRREGVDRGVGGTFEQGDEKT